jgi:membrane protein required for colicin V production
MQTYDYLMIAVLAVATLFGFVKGLAWQIASLASIAASYWVALRFSDRLAPQISTQAPWNKFLAMLIIYVGCSLFIWSAFRIVANFIDRVRLNEFDRQMGALVGFAKGVLLCVAITFFAVSLLESKRQQILASRSGQAVVKLLHKAESITPPEIQEVIGPYMQKVNERFDPSYQPNPAGDLEDLQRLWQRQAADAAASSAPPTTVPPTAPRTPASPISR